MSKNKNKNRDKVTALTKKSSTGNSSKNTNKGNGKAGYANSWPNKPSSSTGKPKVVRDFSIKHSFDLNIDKVNNKGDARIIIDETVYRKIYRWINASEFEVSGLGNIVVDEDTNTIYVVDAILIKQENSRAETEMNANAINKAMYDLRNAEGELRWWWHSHVNMPAFWSGTDTDTMKQLSEHGWFVSTVFNKMKEYQSAITQSFVPTSPSNYFNGRPVYAFIDNISTLVDYNLIKKEEIEEWDKQYDENVKNTTQSYSYPNGNWGKNYDNTYSDNNKKKTVVSANDLLKMIEGGEVDSDTDTFNDVLELHERGEIDEDQLSDYIDLCVGGNDDTIDTEDLGDNVDVSHHLKAGME